MTERAKIRTILLTISLGVAACGGAAEDDASSGDAATPPAAPPPATVTITQPEDGAVIAGTSVTVALAAEGIDIAPAAENRMNTAHHHLFLDRDLTPFGEAIPAEDPQIIHLGDGSSEYTFEGLAPGEHRVIAVLADPAHVPIDPPAADTVSFTIGG